MRFALFATWVTWFAAGFMGCGAASSTLPGSDASASPPGCRAPSACYTRNCACTRDALTGDSCIACDPRNGVTCDCTLPEFDGSQCLEAAQVCVGRAATPCLGVGARCLPVGSTCAAPGGTPPQVVATAGGDPDAGPSTEPRCPFTDDVCCPGAAPDMGVVVDMSVTD